MTNPQPSIPQPPSPEEQDLIAAGNRTVNIMLVGMAVGVIGVIAYGLYRMTSVILANL